MLNLKNLRRLTPVISKFRNIKYPKLIARQLHMTRPLHNNKDYTENYEWLVDCGDYYKMGLSAKAIEELSEIVYVEFEPEDTYKEDEVIVIIESVKAVSDIKAPYDCQIIEKNSQLVDNFDTLNSDPECEEQSWILKLKPLD